INHALKLGASQTWTTNNGGPLTVNGAINTNGQTLTVNSSDFVELDGVISGTGGFTKNGTDFTRFSGSGANTFTGDVVVNTGTLILAKTVLDGAVTGNLTIGNGSSTDIVDYAGNDQIAQTVGNTITLNTTGVL